MRIDPDRPIGEIAVEVEGAIELFEERNINYCFGGRQTLREACDQAGLPQEEVVLSLEKRGQQASGRWSPDWNESKMADIIDLIIRRQHLFIRRRLEAFCKRIADLVRDRAQQDPALGRLQPLICEMAVQMDGHMKEEEEEIFPYLKRAEEALEKGESPRNYFTELPFGRYPLAAMSRKHEAMWGRWVILRQLTHDFQTPAGTDEEVRRFYSGLKDFEEFVHGHAHIEDNILFRKAIRLRILS